MGGLPGGSPLQGSAVSSGVWAVASLGCDGRHFASPDRSGHDWLEKAVQDGDGKLQLSEDLQLKINNIFFYLLSVATGNFKSPGFQSNQNDICKEEWGQPVLWKPWISVCFLYHKSVSCL